MCDNGIAIKPFEYRNSFVAWGRFVLVYQRSTLSLCTAIGGTTTRRMLNLKIRSNLGVFAPQIRIKFGVDEQTVRLLSHVKFNRDIIGAPKFKIW